MSWLDIVSLVDSIFSFLSLIVLGLGWLKLWRLHKCYIKVELSCGSFEVLRKHYNRVDLTPIVSTLFYKGDTVPPEVRKEINELMCKKNKDYRNASSTKA